MGAPTEHIVFGEHFVTDQERNKINKVKAELAALKDNPVKPDHPDNRPDPEPKPGSGDFLGKKVR